jgi:hypothetical protein
MANEFVIKNGYFSQGNSNITGSLTVSASNNSVFIGTGNVGIGTSSPFTKLTVDGPLSLTGTANSNTGSLYIDHQGVQVWKIGVSASNTSTLSIGNDLGGTFANKVLNITNVGNVGIGVNPSHKFDVYNGSRSNTPSYSNATAWFAGLDVGLAIGNYDNVSYGTWLSSMRNNNTEYPLTLQPLGGNVGIGTSTPNAKLDINGNTIITGSLNVTAGITASLFGTASWANNSVTASYAITASYALNSPGGGGGSTDTSSLLTTASFSDPNLVFTKGNGSTFNIDLSGLQTANPIATYQTLTASILSGTTLALPNGLTYVSSSVYEFLEVHINGLQLRYNIDYIPMSTASIKYLLSIPTESELIYKSYKRP